jgi:dihydrodipicolinate synthase/N-acetylneuraminate lyase
MRPDFSPQFGSAQAIMKTALNLRGLPGGYPRPAYLPLTDEETERVRQKLEKLGILHSATNGDDHTANRGARIEQQS